MDSVSTSRNRSDPMLTFKQSNRILDFTKEKRKSWKDSQNLRNEFNFNHCHWGQLKLHYSELEFLTIVSNLISCVSDYVVLYIGAAGGEHLQKLVDMFPGLYFALYDPNPFKIKASDRVEIHTGSDGWFTDRTIDSIKKNPKFVNKEIIFICDIRSTISTKNDYEFEKNVFNEMQMQQRWAIKLNSAFIMLKLRFPYQLGRGGINFDYHDEVMDYKNVHLSPKRPQSPSIFTYLDGSIYFQIYPPAYSTECRLIITKPGLMDPKSRSYDLKHYDTEFYESRCLYYNLEERVGQYEYKDSKIMRDHIFGMSNSMENIAEYYIVEQYLKYKNKEQPTTENIIQEIYNIHIHIMKLTNNTLHKCSLKTAYDSLRKRPKTKIRKYSKKDAINLVEKEYKRIVRDLNYQSKTFKSNTISSEASILTKEQYKNQLSLIKKEFKTVKNLKKDFINLIQRVF
jgi:hypothetical protein